ncbi:MAG: IS66 family transposase [Moorea sp. SIO3C2]|nr:IS66 family transposase [Moorena sp. SIO3C2]
MSESIVIAGIEIPKADWDATPASVQALVLVLSERLMHIEEQLSQNSSNSSLPPSSDTLSKAKSKSTSETPPKEKASDPKESNRKDKKQSRQNDTKSEKAKGFGFYPVEECNIHHHIPSSCVHCGEVLSGVDASPHRHQVVDIPPLQLSVEEHQLHQLTCECCGKTSRGVLPPEVPTTSYGDRLVGFVGLLSSGEHRQSHSMAQSLLQVLFNLEVSRSSINRMRTQVSEAVSDPVEEAIGYVQRQASVHSDETGFPQRNRDGQNPENRKGWLWILCVPMVMVFHVALHRSQQVSKELIGEGFKGIVHSDRYSAYNWLPVEQRQVCWAHLKRDLTKIAERSGVSKEYGEALLARQARLFRWWHRVRDGTMRREQFIDAVEHLRRGFKATLEEVSAFDVGTKEKTPLAKSVRTLREILKVESALWTFVYTPELEPTNNTAERGLRPGVIWRRTTQGSQSKKGSEFVERILTVTSSLKLQGRNSWDYLSEAIRAKRLGLPAPSLLPIPKPQEPLMPLALPQASDLVTT